MGLTERGRWTSNIIDERGRTIVGSLTTNGTFVFDIPSPDDGNTALTFVVNATIPVQSPSNPPNVTIVSVDHYKISKQLGMNQSNIVFNFDTDVTEWSVNVMGVDPTSGTIVSSGGAVSKGTNINVLIPYSNMYEEGYNKVNIYGQNTIGWTPYETDTSAPKVYYLSMNGTSDYIEIPAFTMTHIVMDILIDSNQPPSTYNDGYLRTGQTGEHVLLDDQNRSTTNGYAWIYDGAYDNGISTSWDKVTANGSQVTDYAQIPIGQRITLEGFKSSGDTGVMTVFVHQTLADGFMKGRIYGIKFYNGSTLVANYDMTTGTINDQTGNGYNATLVGGTWVQVD